MTVSIKLQYDERQRVADKSEEHHRPKQHNVDNESERSTVQLLVSLFLHRRPIGGSRRRVV